MTKAELLKILEQYPDSAEVVLYDWEQDYFVPFEFVKFRKANIKDNGIKEAIVFIEYDLVCDEASL